MKKLITIIGIAAATLAGASAQVITVGWDFDPLTGGANNFGPSPYSPTTTPVANLTVVGLTRGSGMGTTGTGAGNAWGGIGLNETSFANAVTGNDFVTFSFTPASSYELSFSSISAYNVRRSGTGATTGQWQYSVGTGSFTNIGTAITWGSVTSAAGNSQSSIDLSGISALQGVDEVVNFRLVVWGASGTTGTWYLNDPTGTPGTDLSVSGSLALIPEPSTWALIGLGAAFGLWNMRRKRMIKA